MKDNESRNKGGPVTKATKLDKSLIKGETVRAGETLESGCGSTKIYETAEANVLVAPRPKKTASKNDVAEQIGLGLRSIYDDILAQPVPDRFFDLLRRLETVAEAQAEKDVT